MQNIALLIHQCKKNNAQAQMAVYNQFARAMYNTAYRILGEQTQAEEIMQDSFLKAFEKIKTLQNLESFPSWLKRIVINKCINHLKQNPKYQTTTLFPPKNNPIYIEEQLHDFLDLTEKATNLQTTKLLQKLQQLKPNYKTILTLYYIEGFDLQEIETILKINNQNCRTMLTRAKKSLKNKMSEP